MKSVYLYIFFHLFPLGLFSQGSWNPPGADLEFPRTIIDNTGIQLVRERLIEPDVFPLYALVWQNANNTVPAGNSTEIERQLFQHKN